MRELKRQVMLEIRRVDAEIAVLWRLQQSDVMARIDLWLDRRLALMRSRDRGFVVTDRRRVR